MLSILEQEFFRVNEKNAEYAPNISIVIQMLEQQKNVGAFK